MLPEFLTLPLTKLVKLLKDVSCHCPLEGTRPDVILVLLEVVYSTCVNFKYLPYISNINKELNEQVLKQ